MALRGSGVRGSGVIEIARAKFKEHAQICDDLRKIDVDSRSIASLSLSLRLRPRKRWPLNRLSLAPLSIRAARAPRLRAKAVQKQVIGIWIGGRIGGSEASPGKGKCEERGKVLASDFVDYGVPKREGMGGKDG